MIQIDETLTSSVTKKCVIKYTYAVSSKFHLPLFPANATTTNKREKEFPWMEYDENHKMLSARLVRKR